jgi:hypothetical protein
MSGNLMQALELIGAIRHLGIDASGQKVAIIEVRGVTHLLSEKEMQNLDIFDTKSIQLVQLIFGIINDLMAHVHAIDADIKAQKRNCFERALSPRIVTHAVSLREECCLLAENVYWFKSITVRDIDSDSSVKDYCKYLLEKLPGLHVAMTAKFHQIKNLQSKVQMKEVASSITSTDQVEKKQKKRSVRFA